MVTVDIPASFINLFYQIVLPHAFEPNSVSEKKTRLSYYTLAALVEKNRSDSTTLKWYQ